MGLALRLKRAANSLFLAINREFFLFSDAISASFLNIFITFQLLNLISLSGNREIRSDNREFRPCRRMTRLWQIREFAISTVLEKIIAGIRCISSCAYNATIRPAVESALLREEGDRAW